MNKQEILNDLAKAKAIFQQRAVLSALGVKVSNSTPLEHNRANKSENNER